MGLFKCLVAATLAAFASACAISPERDFVPRQLVATAQIEDMSDVRGWGDEPPALKRSLPTQFPEFRAKFRERIRAGKPVESNILAISGGADDGAFGAGLMVGWGERGDRPEFDLVTGVSAGALIAPFAFLGAGYDRQLSEIFTTYGGSDIYESNVVSGLLGGSAIASNEPLRALIVRFVDQKMLKDLADQRAAGRVLLIGTTNLDAERPVYWDIGKIAQRGDARALELVRAVLLASAALPGIFPPVRISVGRRRETLRRTPRRWGAHSTDLHLTFRLQFSAD